MRSTKDGGQTYTVSVQLGGLSLPLGLAVRTETGWRWQPGRAGNMEFTVHTGKLGEAGREFSTMAELDAYVQLAYDRWRRQEIRAINLTAGIGSYCQRSVLDLPVARWDAV